MTSFLNGKPKCAYLAFDWSALPKRENIISTMNLPFNSDDCHCWWETTLMLSLPIVFDNLTASTQKKCNRTHFLDWQLFAMRLITQWSRAHILYRIGVIVCLIGVWILFCVIDGISGILFGTCVFLESLSRRKNITLFCEIRFDWSTQTSAVIIRWANSYNISLI